MPYQTSDIRKGLKFKMDNAPWNVVEFLFVKPGKGTAFTRTKLKNLITGQVIERNFRTGETLDEVDVQTRTATYSYKDADQYIFMDTETYDQFPIQSVQLGDQEKWLMEGMACDILFYEGRAITVELPNFIEVVVTYSEPAVKGDTANNVTKNAEVSTGAAILVPLFIEEGNIVRIDTRTGEYVGRVATK
jgi:elongation factor P